MVLSNESRKKSPSGHPGIFLKKQTTPLDVTVAVIVRGDKMAASLAQETEPGSRANDSPAAYSSLPYRNLGSSGMEALSAIPYASAHRCAVLFSSDFPREDFARSPSVQIALSSAGGMMDRR